MTPPPLLSVRGLRVELPSPSGHLTVVDGLDYDVKPGEVLGLAGESGSGKTISILALLGLLPHGSRVEGNATFEGKDLLQMREKAIRAVRGNGIAVVFQDPVTSLHPMLTIGQQLTEHMRYHLNLGKRAADEKAVELLGEVRIPDPAGAMQAYPHQFSGGMRQRIAIAIALACDPRLLIADEPTTALDVTVQAGILHLLDRLRRKTGLAVIIITHDLAVMSVLSNSLIVLYAGRVVESGASSDVLDSPRHPYTSGLISALPDLSSERHPLKPILGTAPSIQTRPSGCAFHPRCAFAVSNCTTMVPELTTTGGGGRRLACPVDPLSGQA